MKHIVKSISLILALAALGSIGLAAADKQVEITWWEYPNFPTVDGEAGKYEKLLLADFSKKYPNIKVNLEMLSYNGGPEKVTVAIAANSAPDLVFDYPGRIIDYAKKKVMAPLDDMFTPAQLKDLNPTILEACKTNGKVYMYPIDNANFMMAVNKTMFEEAGLLKLLPLDRPDRLWTTDEFTAALKAIKEKRPDVMPVIIYCKSNQGDQGTRTMVYNLFGGDMMNDKMTAYTVNGAGPVKTLQWIKDGVAQGWIAKGGEAMTSGDAIDTFLQGKAAFTIIYSSVLKASNADKKTVKFEEAFLPWPTPKGAKPRLDSYIGGIGVFDNGDKDKIAAAKKLIDFIANDPVWGPKNLLATNGYSPRASVAATYTDPEMKFAANMVKYTSRYFNCVDGFVKMRTFWFPALQKATLGIATPQAALDEFVKAANDTLAGK